MAEDNTSPFRYCKSMGDFIKKVDEIRRHRDMGLGLTRDNVDWFLFASPEELYPHAETVPWSWQDEQTMDLICIGKGCVKKNYHIFDKRHTEGKLYYGLYSNPERLGKILQSKWKHRLPFSYYPNNAINTTITSSDEFYNDIIDSRADTEMSVFIYVNQELELDHICKKSRTFLNVHKHITHCAEETSISDYIQWLRDARFTGKEEFLTTDSLLKRGTKIIFSITERGGVTAKIISPGSWSRATCYRLGYTDNCKVSEGLIRTILGQEPLDMACKQHVGKNALYLAKGGSLPRSRLEASLAFRHMNDWMRPGTPPYPYPKESHNHFAKDMLCLLSEPPSFEERPCSLNILSTIKRDNRRRLENLLKSNLLDSDTLRPIEHEKTELKLRKLPKGKIPSNIKRYPVEYADLQSPYKFFNQPTVASLKNGYQGYEARVKPAGQETVYRPTEIPCLEPVEDELTCLEIPTHIVAHQKQYPVEQAALLYRYLTNKKGDSYYKGIFYRGDLEKTDVWGSPNKGDPLMDKEFEEAYQTWQKERENE
jgi:hypothetical protein